LSLQDEYFESTAVDLQQRVQMSICTAAQNISSEDPSTPNHASRNMLATQVARNPQAYTQSFSTMLTAEGITRASTDADISNMVSSVWNTVAGTPTP
jgi:hypothetical protein